jgi:predicted hotdog family 3-hydroxylacyl-ACP dehydratase
MSGELEKLIGMQAAEFVLHRPPMLLLDRLVDIGDEFTCCEWQVTDDSEFLHPGSGVPAYVGVEFMAQCVAVHAGARARVRGLAPPLGLLLGTRHFKAATTYFETGASYRTTCRELIRDSSGMGSYECDIQFQDKTVAEACLAVLEKEQGRELGV